MPKTTEQIWKEFTAQLGLDILEAGAKTRVGGWCRVYQEENKDDKWFSDKEVDKIIEQCLNTKIHCEDFKNTGIIRCPICGKNFNKISEYSWKPDCDCFKKDLRISIGKHTSTWIKYVKQ